MMNSRLVLIATALAGAASVGLTSCMAVPLGMPDASVIGYASDPSGGYALPPSCAALSEKAPMRDAGMQRPSVAFGCATYSNLAAMIARPADLVSPRPYAGADAPLAASAVRRYEEGRAIPLSGAYGSSGSSSSSSPPASPAGPQ
jgi:pilus assembly protein CpaD